MKSAIEEEVRNSTKQYQVCQILDVIKISKMYIFCFAFWIMTFVSTIEGVDWTTIVDQERNGVQIPSFIVYFGSKENRLPDIFNTRPVDLLGLPFITIGATDTVINPITNRPITGDRLQTFFGVSAGTILFFDTDGLPIPQLNIPQALHGNDPELFGLYLAFVKGGHYRSMTIAEYARALGKEPILARALARIKSGFAGRELTAGEHLVRGIAQGTGEPIDPWQEHGVFIIYAASGRGRVARAQIQEIHQAFSTLEPHITLIVPEGEDPPPLDVPCVLAHAPRDAIEAQGPSPLLVFTAQGAEGVHGVRLNGFQPAEVLAKLIGIPLHVHQGLNHDIPYAEVDTEQHTHDSTSAGLSGGDASPILEPAAPPAQDPRAPVTALPAESTSERAHHD